MTDTSQGSNYPSEAHIAASGIDTPSDFWIDETWADGWRYVNAAGWRVTWDQEGWTVVDPDGVTTNHSGDLALRQALAQHMVAA